MKPARPLCVAMTRYDLDGLCRPRRCRHRATKGNLCGLHAKAAEKLRVESVDGGWCVWCGAPGRRYTRLVRGVPLAMCIPIALCGACGAALGITLYTERLALNRKA